MLIVLLAVLMVLVYLLINRKIISRGNWTWEDDVILAAQVKRQRKNQRRIREDNPKLWTARKAITRVK